MSETRPGGLRVAEQFALLVYPFRHRLSGPARGERLARLAGPWRPWWARLDPPQLQRTLDDTWFFLPHVRQLLCPETDHLPHADPEGQHDRAYALARLDLPELDRTVGALDRVLRLTYDPSRLRTWEDWRIEFRREGPPGEAPDEFSAPLDLAWIDVALFPQEVGLLLFKVRLREDRPAVERLRDCLYHLRPVLRPKLGWELARWTYRQGGAPCISSGRALVEFLLQGFTDVSASIAHTDLAAFSAAFAKIAPQELYTARQHGQSYGQFFHTYTCACLEDSPAAPTGSDPLADPFTRALYELGTLTDTSSASYHPDPDDLARTLRRGRIAVWDNWQGLVLHDNVIFLGKSDTSFLRNTALPNMEEDYFHLYLLVVFQKVWLSVTFGDLVQRDDDLRKNLNQARCLWNSFIKFQNQCWFHEVTRRPQGHLLYRRFQRALNVLPLYEELSEQVQSLQGHYERIDERGVSRLLAFLTVVGLPAGLVTQIYGAQLKECFDAVGLPWWAASLLAFGLSGGLWWSWRRWLQNRS